MIRPATISTAIEPENHPIREPSHSPNNFIPLPGFAISIYGRLLAPVLTPDQMVVTMPGTLAALEFRETLRSCGKRDAVISAENGGLPLATRLIEPGRVKTFHIN